MAASEKRRDLEELEHNSRHDDLILILNVDKNQALKVGG